MKHEWRKKEKEIYLARTNPDVIEIPEYKFLTIKGEGSPASDFFSECIGVLYALSYAIKMGPKKMMLKPQGYYDYTVYPLEGVWDISEKAKKNFSGIINKDDLVFKLVIRQPDFVDEKFFEEMLKLTKEKKSHVLLDQVFFEHIREGKCVQMMHIGSYDNEASSFKIMEEFSEKESLNRVSMVHREIYLSDFRKTEVDKLKTILRFKVESK